MPWDDRLKPASYTPPGGQALSFEYATVSVDAELRGSRYDFPDREGTYVQPTGSSGRSFPLRIFISGPDYDIDAEQFLDALRVPGIGVLDHPVYGSVNVVPMGRVSRRDDLVRAAAQAVFDVTFWETIGTLYPSGQTDPASAVAQSIAQYNEAAAQDFADGLDITTEANRVAVVEQVRALTDGVQELLGPVANATESVRTQFDDIYTSINSGINSVVGQPLDLAFQIGLLIQAPGRAAELWGDKLAAYGDLATQIFGTTPEDGNELRTSDLYASGAVTGLVVSAANTQFTTQPEALTAAQNILAFADELTAWRDSNYDALGQEDAGNAYQAWQQAAAVCAGFLVEISFTLAQERTITLMRDRTIIDVCAQLYGEIDEKLDFFINTNSLSGSEIFELPAGRVIKYYV